MTRAIDWGAMTRESDPPADRTVAAIIGPWSDAAGAMGPGMARLAEATRLMGTWTTNASLQTWADDAKDADPGVIAALRAYVEQACVLPAWARATDMALAEDMFMDYGPLSCTLLFCASLPECYVLPHLSQVLHVAGQLEAHAEHRIRQTAAMVFPVMMEGGLTQPEGSGVAQVLKVRLIHATIRHLILRGSPQTTSGPVAAREPVGPRANLHQALMASGWNTEALGLPCNQLELAYTLLTFSYVFLRGMRTLRIPMSPQQEHAYLHAWNVVGHVLGIQAELMAHSMEEAAAMFEAIQAMGTRAVPSPDVRPGLGRALIAAMADSIRLPVIRGLPVPLTRWLIGRAAARVIGVDQRVALLTWLVFNVARIAVGLVDGVVRLVLPQFSLTRMFTRVVGYHLLTRFLLDQTRPLTLPEAVLNPMHATVAAWHVDARAPGWVNRLEDRLTAMGPWSGAR